eukprot:6491214-Amphidinium_carterae.1
MRAVSIFHIYTNSFKGTIPESGIRTISAVTKFDINTNSFEGVLPESGLEVLRAVSIFRIDTNSFKGTIPASGLRRMSAVTRFYIGQNRFEGALPESGLQVLRTIYILTADTNSFAGTLPDRAVALPRVLSVAENDFEGKLSQTQCGPHLGTPNLLTSTGAIPSSLNPRVVFLGHNLLGGRIPQRLLGGSEQAQNVVCAKALECPTRQQGQHAMCLACKKDGTLVGKLSTGRVVDSKLAPMLGLVGVRTSVLGWNSLVLPYT